MPRAWSGVIHDTGLPSSENNLPVVDGITLQSSGQASSVGRQRADGVSVAPYRLVHLALLSTPTFTPSCPELLNQVQFPADRVKPRLNRQLKFQRRSFGVTNGQPAIVPLDHELVPCKLDQFGLIPPALRQPPPCILAGRPRRFGFPWTGGPHTLVTQEDRVNDLPLSNDHRIPPLVATHFRQGLTTATIAPCVTSPCSAFWADIFHIEQANNLVSAAASLAVGIGSRCP